MPCGPQLIEAVAGIIGLYERGLWPDGIAAELFNREDSRHVSRRAIRYAVAELIKQGRAKRDRPQGPVYAVQSERCPKCGILREIDCTCCDVA